MDGDMTKLQKPFPGNRISDPSVFLPNYTRMGIFKERFLRMRRQRMNGRANEKVDVSLVKTLFNIFMRFFGQPVTPTVPLTS